MYFTGLELWRSTGGRISIDFIHKIKVVSKELKEVRIGIKIIQRKTLIRDKILPNKVMKETQELIQIFGKSIQTAISRK